MTDIVARIMDCCEQVIKGTGRYYCTLYIKDVALTVYRIQHGYKGGFVSHILFRADNLVFPYNGYGDQLQPERGRTILYADPRLFELILETLDEYGGHSD